MGSKCYRDFLGTHTYTEPDYIYTHTHTYLCVYMYMYICVYIYVCVYIYFYKAPRLLSSKLGFSCVWKLGHRRLSIEIYFKKKNSNPESQE